MNGKNGLQMIGRLLRQSVLGPLFIAAISLAFLTPGHSAKAQSIVVLNGAVESNDTPASYDSILVSGTDGAGQPSTYNANAALYVSSNLHVTDNGRFNTNADVTVGGSVYLSTGVINLSAGVFSCGSTLEITGNGVLGRLGGTFSTATLSLVSAQETIHADDVVTSSVIVSATSALTLQGPLTLSGDLILDRSSVIHRATETITADSLFIADSRFDLVAGDSFSGRTLVTQGGTLTTALGATLGDVTISGTSPTGDRSLLAVTDSITVLGDVRAHDGGVVDLVAGTLTCGFLGIEGANAWQRSRGNYVVDGLNISAGAAITFLEDDLVSQIVISGSGSLLEASAPLSVADLSVTNGGVLRLGSFTGSGPVPSWALAIDGDRRTLLDSYLTTGAITTGATPVTVVFDQPSGRTFVTAVPEPSTWCMAIIGLTVAGWSCRRRALRA